MPYAQQPRSQRLWGSGWTFLGGTRGQVTPAAPIRWAARMEKHAPLWLQEQCPPQNDSEMGRAACSTRMPIATDERLVTVHRFQQL